jgi:hypothetical protein
MSSPILSASVEKKVLNFSETSHVSFIILFCPPKIDNPVKIHFRV